MLDGNSRGLNILFVQTCFVLVKVVVVSKNNYFVAAFQFNFLSDMVLLQLSDKLTLSFKIVFLSTNLICWTLRFYLSQINTFQDKHFCAALKSY